MISGIINAKNEQMNIDLAIASLLQFVDEVVVADMGSSDATSRVSERMGARVITVPDYGFVEPARLEAISAATHDWIVVLDADEVIPAALARRLRQLADSDECDAVVLPFTTFIAGSIVEHSGWGARQERHLRMFKRSHVELPTAIHGSIAPAAGARTLEIKAAADMTVRHYNYVSWSHFLAKLNRYTTVEAEQRFADGASASAGFALFRAAREGAWRYVYAGGYKDGFNGVLLSMLMVVYQLVVVAKLRQLRRVGDEAAVRELYRHDSARAGVDPDQTDFPRRQSGPPPGGER